MQEKTPACDFVVLLLDKLCLGHSNHYFYN